MSAKAPSLMSVADLRQRARRYAGSLLGGCVHQSFPFPTGLRGGLLIVFFYGRAEVVEPREGLKLWAPRYAAFLSPATGGLEAIRAVTPADAGVSQSTDAPVGSWLTPAHCQQEEFLTRLGQLLAAWDEVLPAYAAGASSESPALAGPLGQLRALLPALLERPLVPYYRWAARPFLEWASLSLDPPAR